MSRITHILYITNITLVLFVTSALTAPQAGAQQLDARTKRIIEAINRENPDNLGSATGPKNEHRVKAVPITKDESVEKEKEKEKEKKEAARVQGFSVRPGQTTVRPTAEAAKPGKSFSDTLYISSMYTTHIIFATDITYADVSDPANLASRIIEESHNKLAIRARGPFDSPASVSVEEAGGDFHTFIVKYREKPRHLIIDTRPGANADALARLDTVKLSTMYTTHIIFSSDIIYKDVSRPDIIRGKVVNQGSNKLAVKAAEPFGDTASLSVEESNGVFHTYLLAYEENPSALIKDTRAQNGARTGQEGTQAAHESISGSNVRNSGSKQPRVAGNAGIPANTLRKSDAPTLSDVIKTPQGLYHLSTKKYDIRLTCENIYSYSDVTYFVLRLDNGSGISYEVSDATFVVESNNGTKRKVVYEQNLFPKNKFGSLTTQSAGSSRICYSFDKMALSSDQVLKVYLYESGGQRNLTLSISYKDVNSAVPPAVRR